MTEEPSVGLAISGGGYRATLFALGSLWRINDFGLLPKIKTITSVSGGSIIAAYLAMNWRKLEFDQHGVAINFREIIANPICGFCSKGIDIKAGLSGFFSFKDTIGDRVAYEYDKALFKGVSIKDIPEKPDFIFYGSNYQTGSSVIFRRDVISDYKIGIYPNPNISLAKVVGISSAFPPILSPVSLRTNPDNWIKSKNADHFADRNLRTKLMLCDGGLYDNLGIEALWKIDGKYRYNHLLVCDAGAPFKVFADLKNNWISQLLRMTDLMTDQQRALRKRTLFTFADQGFYKVAYWGINTRIEEYKVDSYLINNSESTDRLAFLRTRLNAFNAGEQNALINWGYALSDASIRYRQMQLLDVQKNVIGILPMPGN